MSETQRADPDVLIVGAGPGGLASAMLLAHSGLDVLVVEKCAEVGGRTKIIEQDGFRFDPVSYTHLTLPTILLV